MFSLCHHCHHHNMHCLVPSYIMLFCLPLVSTVIFKCGKQFDWEGWVCVIKHNKSGAKLSPVIKRRPLCSKGSSMLQKSFDTLPQICASTQACLGALRTIPSTSWLGFCSDIHCQLWDWCVSFQIVLALRWCALVGSPLCAHLALMKITWRCLPLLNFPENCLK